MNTIVELIDTQKQYKDILALCGLNLSLKEGEVLGMFGHNGAGKTTSIKLILGLIKPTAGSIRMFGVDPCSREAKTLRRQVGFLQENVSFYDQLTGLEVLTYFARLKKVPIKQCDALLQDVGLSVAKNRRVKTYSKGMRQRLGLAQALLGDPRLLLLDEPTVGLDPIATQDFYHRIELLKAKGCTVILCSHVLPGVEKYIDRALILGNGELLAEGKIQELRQQASLPVTLNLQGNNLQLPEALGSTAQARPNGWELQVALKDKMSSIESLMSVVGLEDLDIHLPSLEDLYTHFITTAQQSKAAS